MIYFFSWRYFKYMWPLNLVSSSYQVMQDSYIETIILFGNSLSLLCIPIIRITFMTFILRTVEFFLNIPWRCRRSAKAWNKKKAETQDLNRILRCIPIKTLIGREHTVIRQNPCEALALIMHNCAQSRLIIILLLFSIRATLYHKAVSLKGFIAKWRYKERHKRSELCWVSIFA